jgi:hypothetical protein
MSGVDGERPLCVVLAPTGRAPGPDGGVIDFDAVYRTIVEPAVEAAGLSPQRADGASSRGIDEPLVDRLVLADVAIADVTTGDPEVLFGLGARHALRPATTVVIQAEGTVAPLAVTGRRAFRYRLDHDGRPASASTDRDRLAERLRATPHEPERNPLFDLLGTMAPSEISRLKTDVFRDRVDYSVSVKRRLTEARAAGADAVRAVRDDLGDLHTLEVGAVVDLLLSLRATDAYDDMIELVEHQMAPVVARTTLVEEQYAFALNRAGHGERAEQLLLSLLDERGPATETYSLLGRVYKDRWEAALDAGDPVAAGRALDQAIAAYRTGFETDWRDAFPGINAVELMELRDPPDPARRALLPIVRYAAERRRETSPDYWDHATLLETAILQDDEAAARRALDDALAAVREAWEPRSTQQSVRRLRETWEARGGAPAWLAEIEQRLGEASPA